MPDPLGIATAVVTLLKSSWTVGLELKKFRDGVSVIDKTLKTIGDDVESLSKVLASMQGTFETLTAEYGGGDLTAHWGNVVKAIEDGNGILGQLEDELQNIGKDTKLFDQSRKQLRLNLAEERLSGHQVRLHSLRETLQLSVQVITMRNQESHHGALMELCGEIRTIAKKINETIDAQHALPHPQQDEAQIASMMNFRECVRSAASIVSSASTAIGSADGESGDAIMSDFGDCFPADSNPAINRWIGIPSVLNEEQDWSLLLLGPIPDTISVEGGVHGSDSDEDDLEDEITTALLEDGRQKLAASHLRDAERILKKCSLRLSNVPWEQGGTHVTKQFSKRAEVLENLVILYRREENWAEAQKALTQKLNVEGRVGRKKDVDHFRDVMILAEISQRKGEAMQALLHARRAWRGFKKLQSTNDVKSCLGLLIEVCNDVNVAEDGEIYNVMLSRLETNTTCPGQHNTLQYEMKAASLEVRSGSKIRQEESSFDMSQRTADRKNDLLPYDTRLIEASRRQGMRFPPVDISKGTAAVQSVMPQVTLTTGDDQLLDNSIDEAVIDPAVLQNTSVLATTLADNSRPHAAEGGSMIDFEELDRNSDASFEAANTFEGANLSERSGETKTEVQPVACIP